MSNTMTPERAIEILKNLTYVKVLENNAHSNEVIHSESACKKDNEDLAAIQMAMSALEKQMPKKVILTKTEVTFYQCPCCNSFISRSNDFCNKCGQALDWRDSDK